MPQLQKFIGFLILLVTVGGPSATADTSTAFIKKKRFKIKFDARDAGQAPKQKGSGVTRAELWLSTDGGKTYRMVRVMDKVQMRLRAQPGTKLFFPFEAKYGDGNYWFIIRTVDQAGNWSSPAPSKGTQPRIKVTLDSTPPRLEVLRPADRTTVIGGKNLYVHWRMRDAHPRATPVMIEYRLTKVANWKVLGQQLPDEGRIPLPLPFVRHPDASIRVTAIDRLNNKTVIMRRFGIQTVPDGEQLQPKKKVPSTRKVMKRRKPQGVTDPGPRILQLCARARSQLEEARYEVALSTYKKALALQPRYVTAVFDAGICHFYLKRYDQAWKQFELAISMDPDNPGLYLRRGHAYFQRGQFAGALNDLHKSISLSGDDHNLEMQAQDLVAEIYRTRKAFEEAIKAWQRITMLGDNNHALVRSARANIQRYRNRVQKK